MTERIRAHSPKSQEPQAGSATSPATTSLTDREALQKYTERISVNKRGFKQEKFRVDTITLTLEQHQ